MPKICSPEESAALIPSDATVVIDGSGGGVNEADKILKAIEERFLATGRPNNLTCVHPSGVGDHHGGGVDRFAHQGMVRRVIGGHWGWSDNMQAMASAEQIEAYCLPQGVISHLMRAVAGGRPGLITHIGLHTFIDPRQQGGRLNQQANESLVELMEVDGQEWLFYKTFPVDVAIIRASTADELGNLTMEQEGLYAETLATAQAAKNSGGQVIAQVRRLVKAGSLDPRIVKVPGVLVDAVVVDPSQSLSIAVADDPELYGAARSTIRPIEGSPLNERILIARRAAMELCHGDLVNLGFGMPDGVADVLAAEGLANAVTLTVEQGHFGGTPATGVNFGLARNQQAMIDAGAQFDWYDGGGLDIAVLSFAQVDAQGNVNVSKFNGRTPGVGGFINISQGARNVVFVGTFTTAGLKVQPTESGLQILHEGACDKFVAEVEQISFSGAHARRQGQGIKYVTERAVFELGENGLVLTEVAPGVDLERDVLAHMGFMPTISPTLRPMAAHLFAPHRLGLSLGQKRR